MYMLFNSNAVIALLETFDVSYHDEPITELYLEDYSNLPKQISLGQEVPFSFTIRNFEGKGMNYLYRVYLKKPDGGLVLIEQNSLSLANQESRTVRESHSFSDYPLGGTVFVELSSVDETIHFELAGKG